LCTPFLLCYLISAVVLIKKIEMLSHNLESLYREVLLPTVERLVQNQLFPVMCKDVLYCMDWACSRIICNYNKGNKILSPLRIQIIGRISLKVCLIKSLVTQSNETQILQSRTTHGYNEITAITLIVISGPKRPLYQLNFHGTNE